LTADSGQQVSADSPRSGLKPLRGDTFTAVAFFQALVRDPTSTASSGLA